MKKNYGKMLDHYFWFIVMLLPVILFVVTRYNNPTASQDFFAFVNTFSPFTFVQDFIDQATQTGTGQTFALSSYLAYVFGVELCHIFYDVLVFIPRLAHKWISKAVQND